MKTQISHLEAKITFNLFTNNFIFKHLILTTIPGESDNYNVQTFHCRVYVILSLMRMSQMTTELTAYSLSTTAYVQLVGLPEYSSFPPPSDVPRISMLTKGFSNVTSVG